MACRGRPDGGMDVSQDVLLDHSPTQIDAGRRQLPLQAWLTASGYIKRATCTSVLASSSDEGSNTSPLWDSTHSYNATFGTTLDETFSSGIAGRSAGTGGWDRWQPATTFPDFSADPRRARAKPVAPLAACRGLGQFLRSSYLLPLRIAASRKPRL